LIFHIKIRITLCNDDNHCKFLNSYLILVYKIFYTNGNIAYNISHFNFRKEITWLITIALMAAALPILKNAIIFILEKLYELFIQDALKIK
jgi:hypothetical protein